MKTTHPIAPFVLSFFEDHLVCRHNVALNTVRSYRDAIKRLILYAAAQRGRQAAMLSVEDIDDTLVLGFLLDLEKIHGNSVQTRNHRLTAVKRLFSYLGSCEPIHLEQSRRIMAIPAKRGAESRPVQYLTREELAAMLNAPDRSTKGGRRDHAMMLFMYNTGTRVQETADTKCAWLMLRAPFKVEILGKGHK